MRLEKNTVKEVKNWIQIIKGPIIISDDLKYLKIGEQIRIYNYWKYIQCKKSGKN